MLDYIVVGSGIAGISFSFNLIKNKKEFVLIDTNKKNTTEISLGIISPLHLRKLQLQKNYLTFNKHLISFYEDLEKHLRKELIHSSPVKKIIHSIEEQNAWSILNETLVSPIELNSDENIYAPYGYSYIKNSFKIDTKVLTHSFKRFLKTTKNILFEKFNYDHLTLMKNHIIYKHLTSKRIVFCEGINLKSNPFFKFLPITGNSGEILSFFSSKLNLDTTLKSTSFISSIKGNLYTIGGTYSPNTILKKVSAAGELALKKELKKNVTCNVKIKNRHYGVRVLSNDRNPFIGNHYKHKPLFVYNGLGSKGMLFAPTLSRLLYEFIEDEKEIPYNYDVKRFYKSKYLSRI